jgi:hypothetical protein
VSASNVQSATSNADWQLGFACDAPSTLSVADSGIDDPVNDTGLGSQGGDFQVYDEFARLVQVICEGSGEFL